jgi:hypothetical protein
MPTNQTPQRLDQTVRVLQIIVGALIAGVVSFAAVAIVVGSGKPGNGNPILWLIGAGFALMMLAARSAIGPAMVNGIRRQIAKGTWKPRTKGGGPAFPADATDADRLLSLFQTVTIVQCALPEGAAFMNLIAYIVDHQVWSLAIVAVLMLWMSSSFPTRDSVANWIGRQLELIELERGQPS